MDFSDERSKAEDDFAECLGLDDFLYRRDFGRDRGRNPEPTDAQRKQLESLQSKFTWKNSPSKKKQNIDDENEPLVAFDVTDSNRVKIHEGKVLKKSVHSMIVNARARYLFLFNDVLLITSMSGSSSGSLFNFSSQYIIHYAIDLTTISINGRQDPDPNNNNPAFEIITPDRPFLFYVESETEKKIWLEEIESSIFALYATDPNISRGPGWQHEKILGTIHSDCFMGNESAVQEYINSLKEDDSTSLDCADACGMSPLHWSAIRGHSNTTKLLIEAGCDINIMNNGLNTPLLLAGARGHDSVLRLLLDNGADVKLRNLKDRDVLFMSVLYASTSRGLGSILQMLTYHGVDFDQQDSTGASPLHECAVRNLSRSVHLLVDAGAQVNCKHGRNGMTPLQLACSLEVPDEETVRSLLENGAHPNWKDSSGRTAFDIVLATHMTPPSGREANVELSPKAERELIHTWVMHTLPALLEIVKCGGRYSPERIEHLRPSFQDAIRSAKDRWISISEPNNFQGFVSARGINITAEEKNWTSDKSSEVCLLCVEKFSFSNRRHHCRSCGILCCVVCSSKRLKLTPGSKGDRVCDGCFNMLVSKAIERNTALAKARKNLETQQSTENDDSLSQMSLSEHGSNKSKTAEELKGTLDQLASNLAERGEKLETLALKSENLENGAQNFLESSRRLKEQMKRNGSSYPFFDDSQPSQAAPTPPDKKKENEENKKKLLSKSNDPKK